MHWDNRFACSRPNQINLPHLIERISLLVIITFGEMIMGLADFFTLEHFSIHSILYFIIMINLFMNYFGQFDHAIDEEGENKGIFLIYSHYPIFIGLIMVTVSMSLLVNPEAHHLLRLASSMLVSGSSKLRSCQMVASTRVTSSMTKSIMAYKLHSSLSDCFFPFCSQTTQPSSLLSQL